MKKKGKYIAISILAFMLAFVIMFSLVWKWLVYFSVVPSPSGEHELIVFMLDKGGAGYEEAYFVKEKGLFSKWHLITTELCSPEWVSENEIEIYHPELQHDNPKRVERNPHITLHSIDEFMKEK